MQEQAADTGTLSCTTTASSPAPSVPFSAGRPHLEARRRLHHVARHARQRLGQVTPMPGHRRRQLLFGASKGSGHLWGRQRLHAAAQHAARHGARAAPHVLRRLFVGAQAQAGTLGLQAHGRQQPQTCV